MAVQLQLAGSKGTVSDDANNDASVVATDHQIYTATIGPVSGCTNFDNGQYAVAPGTTLVGCVTFQLPTGANVAVVRFNPSGGLGAQTGQWQVP